MYAGKFIVCANDNLAIIIYVSCCSKYPTSINGVYIKKTVEIDRCSAMPNSSSFRINEFVIC